MIYNIELDNIELYDKLCNNPVLLNYTGLYYQIKKNFKLAEKYYSIAIEKVDKNATVNIGILYYEQKKYDLAEKYYLIAINKNNIYAMNNLAIIYKEQKHYKLAEKYYLMAGY